MLYAACQFLRHLKFVKNASEHTIRNYAIDLNAFKTFLEETIPSFKPLTPAPKIPYPLKEREQFRQDENLSFLLIDRKTIRAFLAQMNAHNVHRKTILRRLSTLRTFFKYILSQNWIALDPTEEIDTPKAEKKIPACLSYDQIKVLFEQPDINHLLGFRDRVVLELFYSSGLRVSELVALNRNDFDSDKFLLRIKGKGKKERIVPITKNAAGWIQRYLAHPERHINCNGHFSEVDPKAIFLNKRGTRLSVRSVDRNFEKFFKLSGLAGKATPHVIRHTIATHWLENGMDLKTIQALLGHSCLATTTIYTQVSSKLKKKVYNETHPRA